MAGCHRAVRARCALQKERSGEEGAPLVGRRVGESVFRRQREPLLEAWMMASPLGRVLSLVGGEYHA